MFINQTTSTHNSMRSEQWRQLWQSHPLSIFLPCARKDDLDQWFSTFFSTPHCLQQYLKAPWLFQMFMFYWIRIFKNNKEKKMSSYFFNEMNALILQGHIKLIKTGSKDICNVKPLFYIVKIFHNITDIIPQHCCVIYAKETNIIVNICLNCCNEDMTVNQAKTSFTHSLSMSKH